MRRAAFPAGGLFGGTNSLREPSSFCVQGCPVAQLRCLWRTGPRWFFDLHRGLPLYNPCEEERHPSNWGAFTVAALAALCLGGAWAWQSPRRLERQHPVQRRHLVRKRSFIQPGRAAASLAHLLWVCHTRWASFAVRIIVVDAVSATSPPGGGPFLSSQQIFILSREALAGGPADEQLFAQQNFLCLAMGLSHPDMSFCWTRTIPSCPATKRVSTHDNGGQPLRGPSTHFTGQYLQHSSPAGDQFSFLEIEK